MIAVAIRCGLFVFSTVYLLTLACYLIFEAHTPEKHAETLFCFFGALLAVLWYTALLFKSQKYAKFLDEVNEIIESSKFNWRNSKFEIQTIKFKHLFTLKGITDITINSIYENVKIKIEWMTEKTYLAIRTFELVYMLVPVILSLFNYFTRGFSNESFQQAVPAS